MSLEPTRDDVYRREIGQRLRAARESLGLSQRAAGEKAGVSHVCIGMCERGESGPSLELLRILCGVYGVGFSDILCDPVNATP